ncbi:cupin domain-containing protein [Streptomyces sp. AC536]|uniref:cupin domain-containing protein n=1 Tax=Streptomyces buecherae TaxID=2763006 RepID=UPI00164DF4C6|nr:cupin domain-containing protein [Streptomyces buecherae]MBC3983599.1 cupin domain-containing protein [Streptomyces buecherae]QNJ42139.1 cupin domain-containing protein [Streptomyces buecherae]
MTATPIDDPTAPIRPVDLFASFLHLHQDGHARAAEPVFQREGDGWQLMTFHVETDADVHGDHWEVHPEAEEVVACLAGGIRLYFRPERPDEAEEEVAVAAGSAVIVPRGRWHRIALDGPSDIMSLTVPRGSRLEKRGADA